jgi:hypothetical protein
VIGSSQPQELSVQDSQVDVTPWFRQQLRGALKETFRSVPDEFVSWLDGKLALNGTSVPAGQVIGAQSLVPHAADPVDTSQTTTSAALADLATVGPTLDDLTPGASYVVFWGCDAKSSSTASNAGMVITFGPAYTTTVAAGVIANGASFYSVARFAAVTLPADCSSLRAKYQSSDGAATATFANRSLLVIKYRNP